MTLTEFIIKERSYFEVIEKFDLIAKELENHATNGSITIEDYD